MSIYRRGLQYQPLPYQVLLEILTLIWVGRRHFYPPPPLLPLGFPLITQKLQTWQFAALSNFSLETLLLNLVSLMIPSFQIILGKTQTVVFPICGFLVNPLWLIWSNPEAWSPDSGVPGVWFADTSKIKEVLVRRGYSPDISFSNISCYITGQWGASSE